MKNPLETSVQTRAKYEKIQHKTLLIMARLTAQSGRLLFVTDEVLVKRLGITTKGGNPNYKIRVAFKKLSDKKLIAYQKTSRGWSAHLTPLGKKHAEKLFTLDRIVIEKPKNWDGRWRVVIFDIWERRRPARNKLRYLLQKSGFYKIQNSVWVYPYDCEELIALLRVEMRLGNSVLYIIAEGIEQDQKLVTHFGLN